MRKETGWRILQPGAIDRLLWDRCVASDPGAKIYNYFDYLDTFARCWEGAVYGDYVACFPLTRFKIAALPWLIKPAATQQLQLAIQGGVYLDKAVIEELNQLIRQRYKVISIAVSPPVSLGPVTRVRTNYSLDLSPGYPVLSANFTKSGLRNIKKAQTSGLVLVENGDIEQVIALYRSAYGALAQLKEYVYDAFRELDRQQSKAFQTQVYEVKDAQGKLVFAALMLADHKALYYVLGAPSEQGRNLRATYFFINELIRKYAGSNRKLDFEGSDLKNVADFYRSFGPQEEQYHLFQSNNYVQPIKWAVQKIVGF